MKQTTACQTELEILIVQVILHDNFYTMKEYRPKRQQSFLGNPEALRTEPSECCQVQTYWLRLLWARWETEVFLRQVWWDEMTYAYIHYFSKTSQTSVEIRGWVSGEVMNKKQASALSVTAFFFLTKLLSRILTFPFLHYYLPGVTS